LYLRNISGSEVAIFLKDCGEHFPIIAHTMVVSISLSTAINVTGSNESQGAASSSFW
jgi:hypothetical protein